MCSVRYNEVYVWGDNQFGQLGIGSLANGTRTLGGEDDAMSTFSNTYLPKICCFNTVVQKVACGMSHTVMLSSSGHLYAMGSN